MLAKSLSLIFYPIRTLSLNPLKAATTQTQEPAKEVVKDKYRHHHTEGPELEVTKILMKNGALTSKEIWRSYQYDLTEKKKASQ